MKPNWYNIISRAVEEGVALGYSQAHKHVDNPEASDVINRVSDEVMNLLSEVIIWKDNPL